MRAYRQMLARAPRENATGLPNNVWAMLATLEHYFAITNQSYDDNRRDIRALRDRIERSERGRDQE